MSRCCRVCLDPGSRSRLVGGPPAPSALREPQHQETGAEVSGPWGSSDFYGRDSVSEGSTGWGGAGGRVGGLPVSPSMAQATPAPSAGRSELAEMQFQEPTGFLQLRSQEAELSEAAQSTALPELQSFLELSAAFHSSTTHQHEAAGMGLQRPMQDGCGVLADGTKWEKESGEERGGNGYWKRWTLLRGSSHEGKVNFEEYVWTASDRSGMRELGACKSGNTLDGSRWREEWTESMAHQATDLKMYIQRTAQKWALAAGGDEWEEKWGESYLEGGKVAKYADKWGRSGPDVWHEKWGEEYAGGGADTCVKYTDKWAERESPDGAGLQKWGDKWTDSFSGGTGHKHGEVWRSEPDGSRYNRWWNEEHLGGGSVRLYGNSTGGDAWDRVEETGEQYSSAPHFGYDQALGHSSQLAGVPLPALEDVGGADTGGLGEGLDSF
ncbi:MAG: hypothetical protein WDW36_005137 [Sanguina aurantia]